LKEEEGLVEYSSGELEVEKNITESSSTLGCWKQDAIF
jgi:hypothetical protein